LIIATSLYTSLIDLPGQVMQTSAFVNWTAAFIKRTT